MLSHLFLGYFDEGAERLLGALLVLARDQHHALEDLHFEEVGRLELFHQSLGGRERRFVAFLGTAEQEENNGSRSGVEHRRTATIKASGDARRDIVARGQVDGFADDDNFCMFAAY